MEIISLFRRGYTDVMGDFKRILETMEFVSRGKYLMREIKQK
jgi:hypothetical protein